MTIGWVEQIIDGGVVVDGLEDPAKSTAGSQSTALMTGSFLSGMEPNHITWTKSAVDTLLQVP